MQHCAFCVSGGGGNAASALTSGCCVFAKCICRRKNGMCLSFVWFVVLFSFLPCDKRFLLRCRMPFFPLIFPHGYTVIQSQVIEQQFSFLILNMNRKISLVHKQIFSFRNSHWNDNGIAFQKLKRYPCALFPFASTTIQLLSCSAFYLPGIEISHQKRSNFTVLWMRWLATIGNIISIPMNRNQTARNVIAENCVCRK